ncbi:MAG: outer membrane beta-barrel domain-containing protein [Nitrospiria bacterium]
MRKGMMVFLLGVFLLASATRGFAENRPGAFTLSPFVGGYTFDDKSKLETSPVFGLRAGYNFTGALGAEAVFGYVLTESNRTEREFNQYRYGLDVLYHFTPDTRVVPFIAAGFGDVTVTSPGTTDDSTGAFNYGPGIKYFISDSVALRADVRHLLLVADSRNNLEYTVGLTFLLGGKKAAVAASMPQAPARDTTAPIVTLAIPFNANTDVPLHRKMRVAFSEAMDHSTINAKTFRLHQGKTPVPGVVATPTDVTASFTQTSNLTPGTLYTATMTTGVRDLAGNALASDYVWSFTTTPTPDPTVETKVIYVDTLVMLEDTHFEFDKATLTKKGEQMLDQNIKILKDNPKLKVRIAGYTSAQGTPAYNQLLSERRADTVMTYLIHEGGIAPGRLDTIGYGETRPSVYEPIPSEVESKAAKANMKVLFEVIVK